MSEENTHQSYWESVNSIAAEALSENEVTSQEEYDNKEDEIDTFIHESVDGSSWVIYYSNCLDVIKHTDNEDAYQDIGLEGCEDFNDVCTRVAFYAFRADCINAVQNLKSELPEYTEEIEEDEDEEDSEDLAMSFPVSSSRVQVAAESIFNAFEDVTLGMFDKARKILSEVKPTTWSDVDLQNVIGVLTEFRNGKTGLEETAKELVKLID